MRQFAVADCPRQQQRAHHQRQAGQRRRAGAVAAFGFFQGVQHRLQAVGEAPPHFQALARQFAAHNFDLKYLIRAITLSRAYQLSSKTTHPSQDDPHLFARMAVKGLTAEQFFDSFVLATGYKDTGAQVRRGVTSARAEFLALFANSADKRTEHQTSILQALALMNGKFIADATSLERSQALQAIVESPFLDHRQQLETLFLAALSRPMRDQEAARLVPYVENGGPTGDTRKALADVFWVLLNSSEFNINH